VTEEKTTEKKMTNEERMESYCVDANEANRREKLSPSGRYRLLIRYYSTKKGCWNYSRGTVYRISDDKEICDIKRNYSTFHNSFVSKNDQEYLITGRSYMSQTIVNLDTGEVFEPDGNQHDGMAFCWARAALSPDGNTLLVDGCHWACPYEYRFFDFTDPSKGWKRLDLEPKDEYLYADDGKEPVFNEDGTFMCYQTRKFFLPLGKFEDDITEEEFDEICADPERSAEYDDEDEKWTDVVCIRYTLERQGDIIKVVDKWISEAEQETIKQRKIGREKYEKWLKEFRANDPLYLKYQELLKKYELPAEKYESHGVTHKDWCPDFDKREKRWCRRIVKRDENKDNKQPYTVDLEWAVDTGPIKLQIYKDGSKHEDKFFEHSADEMEKAFNYAKGLITT
jgi:hypothetical protein